MEGPFIPLTQQILKMQIAEQKTAIERSKVLILEMVERKSKNTENIAKTQEEIGLLGLKNEISSLLEQKKKMHLAAQQSTIERQIFENMEADERIEKAKKSIQTNYSSLEQYTQTLTESIEAHKDLTLDYFEINQIFG